MSMKVAWSECGEKNETWIIETSKKKCVKINLTTKARGDVYNMREDEYNVWVQRERERGYMIERETRVKMNAKREKYKM